MRIEVEMSVYAICVHAEIGLFFLVSWVMGDLPEKLYYANCVVDAVRRRLLGRKLMGSDPFTKDRLRL